MSAFLRGFLAGLALPAVPFGAFIYWVTGCRNPWREAWLDGPGWYLGRREDGR